MQSYLTSQDGIGDLAKKAALRERCPEKLEARFRSLLESGVIKTSTPSGSEFALRIQLCDRFVAPALVAGNLLRYLQPALQKGCSAGIDFSGVSVGGFRDWLAEFSAVLAAGSGDYAQCYLS